MIDLRQAYEIIDAHDFRVSTILPSVWAEKNRVMSTDVSSFPGQYSYKKTPYLKELINCLSVDHPARVVAVMKGAQIGFSTGVIENGIGWIISENPAPILLISGDKELSKEIVEKRIDQMIDSTGIRHLIRPNTLRKRNQRTGDTSTSKEFPGGYLTADGANNANKLRQRSFKYGFIDDFEAAPSQDKKAGSITKLIEQRFASYYSSMKLFYISTPEIKQTSNIEPVFLLGDQRKYMMPCPICGELISFEWKTEVEDDKGKLAGVTFETDDKGNLISDSVGYTCQKCGKFFTEKHKYDMLQAGIWVPTAEPSEVGYYSYHLSALYAPPGMYDWEYYARDFLKCYPNGLTQRPDIAALKTFLNVCLGQTFEERGTAPKILQITQNTREYKIGTVPKQLSVEDGAGRIVMLTCACDLNGKVDDARLDYEVLAHTENKVTYSIDAGSIGTFRKGIKSDEGREIYTYRLQSEQYISVWDIFLNDVLQKAYKTDTNELMPINIAGIDTGNFTTYAYSFIEANQDLIYPSIICGLKGDIDKFRRFDSDVALFRKSKEQPNLWLLEVNQVKNALAEFMALKWSESSGLTQPYSFMNFPEPEGKKYSVKWYFSHFESEHKVEQLNKDGSKVGYRWQKRHSTVENHFWDCRVYNLALRDIFAYEVCLASKIKYPDWGKFVQLINSM